MRVPSIVATAVLLTCCSTPEEREHNALMDRIEKQVQLPKGAMQPKDYAQFYVDYGKGQIVGLYVLPSEIEREATGECEQLTSVDGGSKKVPCVSNEVRKVKAGERRWLSRVSELPGMNARGCQIVTVVFDQRSGRFEEVSCVVRVNY